MLTGLGENNKAVTDIAPVGTGQPTIWQESMD